jgi:hypothetical protein
MLKMRNQKNASFEGENHQKAREKMWKDVKIIKNE